VAMNLFEVQLPDRRHAQPAYLSSHPSTIDRIDRAEAAGHAFAAAHPNLCPGGVCPGEQTPADGDSDCDDCDDEDASDDAHAGKSSSLACDKSADV
jgi:hypothetical protein